MSLEVIRTTRPRARVGYRCEVCSGTIRPGETYRYQAALWDGEFFTWRCCAPCDDLMDEVAEYDDGDGVGVEHFDEWAAEAVSHSDDDALRRGAIDYLRRRDLQHLIPDDVPEDDGRPRIEPCVGQLALDQAVQS